MRQQLRPENLTYLVMWGILFVTPVLSIYLHSGGHTGIGQLWEELRMAWADFALFLALFLVHNFLLAPLLLYRRQRTLYLGVTLAIVAAFTVYQCTTRPAVPPHRPQPAMGHHAPPPPPEHPPIDEEPRPNQQPGPALPAADRQRPPAFIGEHDVVAVVILVLMFGMNLGIKEFFRERQDQKRIVELEKEGLMQQLEYLKYQLNPHFLMNTLNNIHALVDIDPQRAQEAIIRLSKILRYVLYESNHELVPMTKEIAFMENYVELMRMRYGDRLTFSAQLPDDGTGVLVTPMVFISFVENAFKHGVSYQSPSFIDVTGRRYRGRRGEERLEWRCRNSKHPQADRDGAPKQGGVGLSNVRRRLDLIFGSDYSLDIVDGEATYEVTLDIPLG